RGRDRTRVPYSRRGRYIDGPTYRPADSWTADPAKYEEYVLLITIHHILSDAWSFGIFSNELSALYGAYVRGEQDGLPELGVQYADYAVWQRKRMGGEVLGKQAEYWERALAGAPEVLQLPADHVRPEQQSYSGATARLVLDEELTAGLRGLGRKHRTT